MEKITAKEAIEAIRCNYPDSRYSMLREALDMSMNLLEKQIPKMRYSPDSEKYGHFYIRNGFMVCRETNKDIRYPLSSFSDLDYCPRCGQKLIEGVSDDNK